MNIFKKFLLISLLTLGGLFATASIVKAALTYGGGVYTNICGTGFDATANLCNKGCNTSTGTCSSSGNKVLKFTCNGKQNECRSNESSFSSSQSLSGTACGKTVQIDVYTHNCREGGDWSCHDGDTLDYLVWYSGDCAPTTPSSPQPSSPPAQSCNIGCSSDNPCNNGFACVNGQCRNPSCVSDSDCVCDVQEHDSSCDDLSVVGGNNSSVPAKVTLRAEASDNKGGIQAYQFYFGDGEETESQSFEVQHTYETSGSFTAKTYVKDSTGSWITSNSCETKVSVKSSPVESHKSRCSNLFITSGNYASAPTTAKFKVTGYDNKGSIQKYKLDFGNGIDKESSGQTFEQTYDKPGTYTIKAYIQDSAGEWKGGEAGCEENLYIKTKPLTTQPSTGTPTLFTLLGMGSGISGLSLVALKKRIGLDK